MATVTKHKWEGKSVVELTGATADQIWPLFADFCNVHKWYPQLDTCYHVEGVQGRPGLIRYCASTTDTSFKSSDNTTIKWVKERLLTIDPIKRCLSYEVVDNNMGLLSYMATNKVLPVQGRNGCKIEWSFVADPVPGMSFQDLASYTESSLRFMARKMKESLR
ncbi:Polyketide_cyc2 domain-containing protein [Cephalotus follicularis]|uniref:Polyketide_cyc2 domain-containing protein n=1 Tax=Cephalotus follicularis TaxID=3775 RepID=A0A1Q3BCG2_CEPFO|nr:Polyketide_cyc2 domain-containing protein [Cephalotus follicularis]